jgi:hypothetical protein
MTCLAWLLDKRRERCQPTRRLAPIFALASELYIALNRLQADEEAVRHG